MSASRRCARDLSSWRVFYAIRDGYVKARAIADHTGLTRGAVTAAIGRLRDAGVISSVGHNKSRTHACVAKRPPKDLTGKHERAQVRPIVTDAGRLWEVWR